MDEIDRKILYEVAEEARESHNKLAKQVRVSREVFDYRLKKLEEKGIISAYQARISISNFIYGGYVLLIQALRLTKELEKNILDKLKGNGMTQYVGKVGGGFDFVVGFNVKDLNELSEYTDFINNVFGEHKSKVIMLTMIKEIKDSFKSTFAKEQELNNFISMPQIKEKIIIDDIDKKILSMLGKDCTVPSWKIAEAIGDITEVAIRKRIDKLIKNKIILDFRTMINLPKLGYQVHDLLIKTNPKSADVERKLQRAFTTDKKLTYSVKVIGEYDYFITVLSQNNIELNEYISNLRDNFPDLIIEINALPLFEIVSHTQLAENFLK